LRHPDSVRDVAFSPDGKTLATCCGDRTVYLWNVASGQEIARLATRTGSFVKVQFSADGRRLTAVSVADTRRKKIDFTYSDGAAVTSLEESTAVITIWSGVGGD
jgi:WD40 repeat protein